MIKSIWDRLIAWFDANVPPGEFDMPNGATPKHLRDTEEMFGCSFPSDVRESYLLHDGGPTTMSFYQNFDLMSLRQIRDSWQMYCEALKRGIFRDLEMPKPSGPIQSVWWDRKWIPLMTTGEEYLIVDLNPSAEGQIGQIIGFDVDDGPTIVLAENFAKWLEHYAVELEAGKYCYLNAMIVPKEEID